MISEVKALLAKKWKNESVDLEPGRHFFDEDIVVRVHGSVEKRANQLVSPTVSIPLIPTLALFWEKAGITRDYALKMLREAITEAMNDGVNEDSKIQARIDDVTTAISTVREELLDKLPKMKRTGKLDLSDLDVEVVPAVAVQDELLVA